MKIALTGTCAIGKTTLCNMLAERLNIPVLPEDLSGRIASAAPGTPVAARKEELRVTIIEWLNKRRASLGNAPDLITDRMAADMLARWLKMDLSTSNAELQKVVSFCRQEMQQYDWIIIPPFRRVSAEARNEVGLIRHKSESMRLQSHSLNIGLTLQLARPESIIFIPDKASSAEERLSYVLKRIQIESR